MTEDELITASEAYEDERRRWLTRRNKANPAGEQWEVVQRTRDNEPISEETVHVHARCYDQDVAEYEMENMRGVAAMKAALECMALVSR